MRAHNGSGFSDYTQPNAVIDVVSFLVDVADQTVVSLNIPPEGPVGAIPATASVEGGAASYRVPIEIPPGRGGMQPDVALTYSSRNGNGIAGVGWSLSPIRTIYRCPKTLSQDGGNRPLQHDGFDRLCFDGQRLVAPTTSYGLLNSEYRTEVDQYDRIRLLGGDMSSWISYFLVEHKNGRVSRYETIVSAAGHAPDVWYLVWERDRQLNNNCIAYTYEVRNWRGSDPERVLKYIDYTGTMSSDGASCSASADPTRRRIELIYQDRPDKRTTYRFGAASPSTVRLAAIQTSVASEAAPAARRYELSYGASVLTGRSLLSAVTLCAGAGPCSSAVDKLAPTTFTYQGQALQYAMSFVTAQLPVPDPTSAGPDWTALVAPDFDGDGLPEHLYKLDSSIYGINRYLETSCGGWRSFSLGSGWWMGFNRNPEPLPFEFSADFDNDGRAELIGLDASGNLAFGKLATCGSSTVTVTSTNLLLSPTGAMFGNAIDIDGDGILDLRYGDSANPVPETVFRRQYPAGPLWDWSRRDTIALPPWPANMVRSTLRDLNGDGLVDITYEDNNQPGHPRQPTSVAFFQGVGATPQFGPVYRLQDLGGPPGSMLDGRRWIDVNGDGLPDIYDPGGTIYINRGGAPGAGMFQAVALSRPALDPLRAQHAYAMDIDSDGVDELIVPNARTIDWCAYIQGLTDPIVCGSGFDTQPGSSYEFLDKSVFAWDAYRFVENFDGTYQMILVPAPLSLSSRLQAPIRSRTQAADWNGDGMNDEIFSLDSGVGPPGAAVGYQGLPTANLGPYKSLNQAPAPDLLTQVTNGLGAIASWAHQPLSQTTSVAGCDMPTGEAFYVVHNDAPRGPGYAFFTSSMWAVSRFDESNGIGSGANRTCYRYQDAMLNAEGRGFQGFKVIVAEQQFQPAAGEGPGTAGCGGTCSPNNVRATTEFYQEFPLSGRLNRVTVALANRGLPAPLLAETLYWWQQRAVTNFAGAWAIDSTAVLEKKYDPPYVRLAPGQDPPVFGLYRTTVSEIDSLSGEVDRTCSIVRQQTPGIVARVGDIPVPLDVVNLADRRPLFNDVTVWWLGRVDSEGVLSDFLPSTQPISLSEACRVTGPGTAFCSSTPPSCPAVTPSTDSKTHTTNFAWNASSTLVGYRKVQSETLLLRGVQEASSAFAYDAWGNLLSKSSTGRDVPGPTPLTSYTYGNNNYFIATETRQVTASPPLSLISTIVTDAKTGLVTSSQAVQSGPLTSTIYDLHGALTVSTDGAQPVDTRFSACSAGDCVMKRQVFQPGAPIRTEYVDRLGRVIATGTEGFDGNEIVTKVAYNSRGVKVAQYEPWKSVALPGQWDGASASPYVTQYSSIDALGRVGTKTVTRSSSSLFESGRGNATLTTTYAYSTLANGNGLRTDITVNNVAGQPNLSMSRTYDRSNKLVETTQHLSAAPSHDVMAKYFYDPAGNLKQVLDSSSNSLVASYDDVGRKTSVNDPDRGLWTYAWDGLGRLKSRTDARGVVVSNQYDGVGRQVQRFVQAPGDLNPIREAAWQYDVNGRFGVLGVMIGADAKGADAFRREYKYDARLRPFNVRTWIPASVPPGEWPARDFTVEYGYDRNFGRLKAMSYPSGELVAFDYDNRGNLIAETQLTFTLPNFTRGTRYRHVSDMSERGQVTLQDLANGIVETASYDSSTGMLLEITTTGLREPVPPSCPPGSAPNVRQMDYTYDHFLNLAKQVKQFHLRGLDGSIQFSGCTPLGGSVAETYQYDDLQRLLGSTRAWVNIVPDISTTFGDGYAYDDLGNITSKSDYGSYAYGMQPRGADNAGPHAVASVSGGPAPGKFSYDLNGNAITGAGRAITFDKMDRPIVVMMGGVATLFQYAPDGSRYLQRTTGVPTPKTVYYVDKDYERIDWATGTSDERSYLGNSAVAVTSSGARSVFYRHLERLGSSDAMTTAAATEVTLEAHGFDAFGLPRGRDWQPSAARLHPGGDYGTVTELGFTRHEHLDDTFLIHMNGRVYDYRLGRFLSVDPIISNPANSQSINPYSYIGNNPLSGVDPTGYTSVDAGCGDFAACDVNLINPSGAASALYTPSNAPQQTNSGAAGQGAKQPATNTKEVNSPATTANNSENGASANAGGQSSVGNPNARWAERLREEWHSMVWEIEPKHWSPERIKWEIAKSSRDDISSALEGSVALSWGDRAKLFLRGLLSWEGVPYLIAPGLAARAVTLESATTRVLAAEGAAETTTVIGRVKDLQKLGPGEKSLLDRLPNLGNPKANWQQNAGVLREEMRLGRPIRDTSPGDTAGQFLNAERNLLRDRGWTFDPQTNFWMPPKP